MYRYWIWLSLCTGLSHRGAEALLETFGTAQAIYSATEEELLQVSGLTEKDRAALADRDLTVATGILKECDRKDIQLCVYTDPQYPARLKNISDPPMVLYYKGRLPDWEAGPVIGVVGTRKATLSGLRNAKSIGFQLGRCGALVVSGAADGIDGAAMEGALLSGCPVIGVLGNGADVIYPKCNRALYGKTQQLGCLITEFPPGTRPFKWNFPRRNRIISGLSNGVVVVESPARSGSLDTAKHAADQGRDVFALPGNVEQESYRGNIRLLRDGATLIRDGLDVIAEYAPRYPRTEMLFSRQSAHPDPLPETEEGTVAKVAQELPNLGNTPAIDKEKEKKPVDNPRKQPYSDGGKHLETLPDQERQLAEKLYEPRLVDDLIAQENGNSGKVLSALTMLEVRGLLTRLPGNRVVLKEKP